MRRLNHEKIRLLYMLQKIIYIKISNSALISLVYYNCNIYIKQIFGDHYQEFWKKNKEKYPEKMREYMNVEVMKIVGCGDISLGFVAYICLKCLLIKDTLDNLILRRVTFSGGDPWEQADKFAYIAKSFKEKGLNIWSYTGYTYEYIIENKDER